MSSASNAYLRNAVMTASPAQLHLMLYDGAVRFTRSGIEGVDRQDWEAAFQGFSRAQKIMLEMHNALNFDVDEELCKRMAGLYNFIYRKLVDASMHRDAGAAREALNLLEYQRETWSLLMEKLASEASGESAGAPELAHSAEEIPEYGTISLEG